MAIPPEVTLRVRAYRILTDGKRHAVQAVEWALSVLGPDDLAAIDAAERLARAVEDEQRACGFSLRELSLGAQQW